MSKKIYIRTLGCQMNVRDSEVICGLLRDRSYEPTANPDEADVVIFNTCSVRQHAEDRVWSAVGEFKEKDLRAASHQLRARPIIGIVGCMAQNYREKIFERSPNVDFVVGPSDIGKIPEIIKSLSAIRYPLYATKIWETDAQGRPEEVYHSGFYEDKDHAYVVISEGCSNFCSYCVVPYVRGALHNRNHEDILREINQAVDKGITKVTLLGQNVNAYGVENRESLDFARGRQKTEDRITFVKLLRLVNRIEGLKEFSFITSHPKDTSEALFKAMSECQKLKKWLHLPVQSGSDRVLKLMNRGYTRKFYLDLVDNYRKIVKAGALTTDIIVGFPSEAESDFQDSCDLVKALEFDAAYIFKYSPRPNTKALNFNDDVGQEEKKRRHSLILDLQKKISRGKK